MSGNLSQDEINMLLGKQAAGKDAEKEASGEALSQDAIDALLAKQQDAQESPPQQAPRIPDAQVQDHEGIDALVAQNRQAGGSLDQSQINHLIQESQITPESVLPENDRAALDQSQIDQLLAAPPQHEPEDSAKTPAHEDKGIGLDQGSIDALFAQSSQADTKLDQDQLNSLIDQQRDSILPDVSETQNSDYSLSQSQVDDLIAKRDQLPDSRKEQPARDSRGSSLDQSTIDALIANQGTGPSARDADQIHASTDPSFQVPEIASSDESDSLDQGQIDALLEQQASMSSPLQTESPQVSSGHSDDRVSLDQDAIDALINQGNPASSTAVQEAREPQNLADARSKVSPDADTSMSQNEIDALLAQNTWDSSTGSASLDQGAIDALINQQDGASPQLPVDDGATNLDQSMIDALLAQQAAPQATQDNANLGQDQIDALLAQQSAAQPQPTNELLDQGAIDALINQQDGASPQLPVDDGATNLDQSMIDALLAQQAAPQATQDNANLGQDQIDALLAQQTAAQPQPTNELLDQGAIDALINQQDGASPQLPVDDGATNLDQSMIDALLAQQAAPQATQDNANLGQDQIDALLAQQTAAQPQPTNELLDQGAIDSIIAQQNTPLQPESAPAGNMDQDAIDALLAGSETTPSVPPSSQVRQPVPQPKKPVTPFPNSLMAKTMTADELRSSKLIRSWSNRRVTGVHQGRVYLPDEMGHQDSAMNAIQRLFALAGVFREATDRKPYVGIASVTNRYGLKTQIHLSKNRFQPVRIKVSGLPTFNSLNKHGATDRIYDVDHFKPNSGMTCKRWVHWFSTQFDRPTLQELSQLRG